MIVAGLFGPVYDPEPEPDQPLNLEPEAGVADMDIEEPASYQPEFGETDPPPLGFTCMVR